MRWPACPRQGTAAHIFRSPANPRTTASPLPKGVCGTGEQIALGDADRILPFDKTGKRLSGLIADMELVVVEGGPQAIPWTHSDEVNAALLRFLGYPPA
jgi:hypothetical protein